MLKFSLNRSYYIYQNVIFSLFFISGSVKFFFIYYHFPVDLTLLTLILILLDTAYSLLFRVNKIKLNLTEVYFYTLFSVFCFWTVFSLSYTPSDNYAYSKVMDFSLCVITVIYPIFIGKMNPKVLFKVLLFTTLPIAIWYIVNKYIFGYSFFKSSDELIGGQGIYGMLGMNVVFLAILGFKYSKYFLPIFLISLLTLLGLGSRGPLLYLVISITIFYWAKIVTYKLSTKNIWFGTLILAPLFFLVIRNFQKIIELTAFGLTRFVSFFNPSQDNSIQDRLDMYGFAIKHVFTTQGITIGNGIGSFGSMYFNKDVRAHPHNMLLEVWFELGTIGIMLISLIIILPFTLRREIHLKAIAFCAFLRIMESSSFAMDRSFYALLVILLFTKTNEKKIT